MWKSNKSVYTRGPLFVPHLIQRSSALRVDAIQPPPHLPSPFDKSDGMIDDLSNENGYRCRLAE